MAFSGWCGISDLRVGEDRSVIVSVREARVEVDRVLRLYGDMSCDEINEKMRPRLI